MRVFYAFLLLMLAAVMLFVDAPQAVYDFRTKVQRDTFNNISTGVAVTGANLTITQTLYGGDTSTFGFSSNISEAPLFSSYNATTRALNLTGLTANTTRSLVVSYDITALSGLISLNTFMNLFPYFWYLIAIALMVSAVVYPWVGKE